MVDQDSPQIERAKPALPAKDTFRVLLMDTVEHTDQLKAACKDAGHTVVTVHSIDDAIKFLDGQDHVDVIVCAAYMEDEDLFEFLKRLRSNPHHRETMFMALALQPGSVGASINESTAGAGKLLGADAFVSMPEFDPQLLIDEIKKLLPLVPMLERSKRTAEKKQRLA